MASTYGRVRGTFALMGLVSIVVIYAIVTGWDPLPGWGNWLENVTARNLSTPSPVWSKRAGDEPDSATVLPNGIVVVEEGSVEVRDPTTGAVDWTRAASWAGVAGGAAPVVMVGRPVGNGFDVYDVTTGLRIWGSNDKAGIWPYADKVLMLTCSGPSTCVLRSVDPGTGRAHWSTTINGSGAGLYGFQHTLAGLTQVSSAYATPLRGVQEPAPELIGLPMAGSIHVINTGNGRQLHTFASTAATRVVVTDHYVIASSAVMRGSQCYYSVVARSPSTGGQLWQRSGIDLRTAAGLGCESSSNPYGSGDDLLGIDIGGHDIVVSASSGNVLFQARTGERVVAMDTRMAVVRTADHKSLRAVTLGSGHQQWEQGAQRSALVGVAPDFVLVADPTGEGKLVAYARQSGAALLSVTSTATVLGIGSNLIMIYIGRTIGPLAVGSGP
ncbi:MAG TPA: PQQ-binding-like beta-propeller repeat protein [Micromonosporaceae bacterium]